MRRYVRRTIVIVVLVIILMVVGLARPAINPPDPVYGVSFSKAHAEWIVPPWQEVYQAILFDLGVKNLRLAAYWNEIEPQAGEFDFADLDYMMDQAAAADAQVILAVGRKLPRWPECHTPEWAYVLPEAEQQARVLAMLPVVIERYKDHPALKMWQLENEPLLDFGGCPAEDREFLAAEEALLRSLDDHQILVTDSGELNSWIPAAKYGDVLGTTMYRTVHSQRTNRPFHYDYIFPAWMYRAKARLVYLIRGKPVIISELQGEPWGPAPWQDLSDEERDKSLSAMRLLDLKRFAERTQLGEAYWWGVEYWYWEKEVNGNPVFWEMARRFF